MEGGGGRVLRVGSAGEIGDSRVAYRQSAAFTRCQEIAAQYKNVEGHNFRDSWRT